MQARGKFITLEGGEGSGKSTQVERLADRLRDHGITVVTTREPGGGSISAEAIRRLLVEGATDRWQVISEVLLHNAARAEHLANLVVPALRRGDWVISDRYADSTMAYQGYGHGFDKSVIDIIHRSVAAGTTPDLTLVLDVPVETGIERAGKRAGAGVDDRYERMGTDFHERVRQGFLEIALQSPERCEVTDASCPQDEVFRAITEIVARRLGIKKMGIKRHGC